MHIRNELLYPELDKCNKITFGECVEKVFNEKDISLAEMDKIDKIKDFFADYPISRIQEAWTDYLKFKPTLKEASSRNRVKTTINSVISYMAEQENINPPILKKDKVNDDIRIRHLELDIADKFNKCYSLRTQDIILFLRYQGTRSQETLQLLWEQVNLKNKTAFIAKSKNGEARTIYLHDKVWEMLKRLNEARGKRKGNLTHVFITQAHKAYKDTRSIGGNPLAKAHENALMRAEKEKLPIKDFTLHDWRHHWASHMVMAGVDLETLRVLGGWKSLKMVSRYAALAPPHLANTINKLK